MLHPHDDLPFHQAAAPVLQTVSGDPNAYDRYFFHGYDADVGLVFVVALGIYPNRQIIDAAFCVAADGHQRSVFASGRLSRARDTVVGPIRVEVEDPMRVLRVTVDAPSHGLEADLAFHARSAAILEPRHDDGPHARDHGHVPVQPVRSLGGVGAVGRPARGDRSRPDGGHP